MVEQDQFPLQLIHLPRRARVEANRVKRNASLAITAIVRFLRQLPPQSVPMIAQPHKHAHTLPHVNDCSFPQQRIAPAELRIRHLYTGAHGRSSPIFPSLSQNPSLVNHYVPLHRTCNPHVHRKACFPSHSSPTNSRIWLCQFLTKRAEGHSAGCGGKFWGWGWPNCCRIATVARQQQCAVQHHAVVITSNIFVIDRPYCRHNSLPHSAGRPALRRDKR
jgi:hypothetical protein